MSTLSRVGEIIIEVLFKAVLFAVIMNLFLNALDWLLQVKRG